MNEEIYKSNNLIPCNYQYIIRHNNINCFNIGEIVFLKSNPELPLIVSSFINNNIICKYKLNNGEFIYCSFPPECILQYKYSSLIEYKNKFKICLN